MYGTITLLGVDLQDALTQLDTIATTVPQAGTDLAALSDYLLATYPNDTQWQPLLDAVQAGINSLLDTGILPPAPPIHNTLKKM